MTIPHVKHLTGISIMYIMMQSYLCSIFALLRDVEVAVSGGGQPQGAIEYGIANRSPHSILRTPLSAERIRVLRLGQI